MYSLWVRKKINYHQGRAWLVFTKLLKMVYEGMYILIHKNLSTCHVALIFKWCWTTLCKLTLCMYSGSCPKSQLKKEIPCSTLFSTTAPSTEEHKKIHTSKIITFTVKLQRSDENWDVKSRQLFGTEKWKNDKKTHKKIPTNILHKNHFPLLCLSEIVLARKELTMELRFPFIFLHFLSSFSVL